jgi:hypothetical protein
LLNNVTYLLLGPVLHAPAVLHGHPSLAAPIAGSGGGAGTNSSAAAAAVAALSRQEMGLMPMHISPSSLPPIGSSKKLSTAAASAASHPFASIPSPSELSSTAIGPSLPPNSSNESLDLRRRFPSALTTPEGSAGYDLDAIEVELKEQHKVLISWAKERQALVASLSEHVDALAKKAELVLKKFETKLRRGHFEVPPTPIDRRRGPGAAPLIAAPPPPPTTAATAASSAGSSAAPASSSSSSADASASPSRKRSYAHLVAEIEAREVTYQLQNELRMEIEKQSSSAMANAAASAASGAAGGAAGAGAAGAAGAAGGAGASGGAAGAAAGGVGGESEPVYCICKKVSFGAMVACDNPDCATEWYVD